METGVARARAKDETSAVAREAAIRRRAEELYERRGRISGHEKEDWLQAEAEVDQAARSAAAPRSGFVVVRIDGVMYTGEYDANHSQDYHAGEWNVGERMPVRFEGDKMYIRRKNGSELKTSIVKVGG